MNIKPVRAAARATLLFAFAALLGTSATAQTGPQPPLPTVRLTAGGMHVIQAEVAQSPQERATGMMFRTEMPANAGMLFVFEYAAPHCFWMSNTLLPLSIAFLADDGTVVNVIEMQPRSTSNHCAAQPVRYALEMNQGWFAKRGIKAGSRLQGGPFGPAK
ncbi:MAG: DUF192 domain-containing protein [Piscinibacter sp.]|nr:DUF192 domain-containing protein [Piscinibacter sp.]